MRILYLTFFIFLIFNASAHAQISFEKGYYIDNSGNKIEGLIKNYDWRNNPIKFQFKESETGSLKDVMVDMAQEFAINDGYKFIRKTLEIDRSSQSLNTLDNQREPILESKTIFIKTLVEGQASLYSFVDNSITLYFFSGPDLEIEQLIYKRYVISRNNLGENTSFRQQLLEKLKCSDFNFVKLQKVDYRKKDLLQIINEYNRCAGSKEVIFEKKQQKNAFNLSIRPRLNTSSTATPSPTFESRVLDFDKKTGFGIGLETEYILPFNKGKWGILVEPSYQSFKSENTIQTDNIQGGLVFGSIDYSSIEAFLGLRHYLFLNNDSRFFINAGHTFDYTLKNSIEFTRTDGSILTSGEFSTQGSYSLGLGFKYTRYSVEFRYVTLNKRNILFSGSTFDSTSLIVGVELF